MSKILLLAGDGIGPEIVAEAEKVLVLLNEKLSLGLDFEHAKVGGSAIDEFGVPLPDSTLDKAKEADAILLGAVGGPKWANLPPTEQPERCALLNLRSRFELFCNMRPATLQPALSSLSTLRSDISEQGFDVLVIRELTG